MTGDILLDAFIITGLCFFPLLIWMMIAGVRVKTVFAKHNYASSSRLRGKDAARAILDREGLFNVAIAPCKGHMTDHYDPRNNTVYLSESTYNVASVSAIGVASHEVGHALQYAKGYVFVKVRTFLLPLVNLCSNLAFPLLTVTILIELISGVSKLSTIMLGIAVCFYGMYILFLLITLPVEYNASRRAKKALREFDIIPKQEVRSVAKVLGAAANTYLSSFVFSFFQFLRYLLILLSRSRNR